MTTANILQILVIDDGALEIRPFLEKWKETNELPVIQWEYALSGDEGIAILKQQSVDVVLMDGHLIDEYGSEVIARMRAKGINTPVIMFSSNEQQNRAGIEAGAEFSCNKNAFLNEIFERKEFMKQEELASILLLIALRK